jgi:hypothetical protein
MAGFSVSGVDPSGSAAVVLEVGLLVLDGHLSETEYIQVSWDSYVSKFYCSSRLSQVDDV